MTDYKHLNKWVYNHPNMKYFKKQIIKFDIERLQRESKELLSREMWMHPKVPQLVKGVCMTQIPGDPSSATNRNLRGLYYTKPDSTGEEVTREDSIEESKYTEFCEKYKGTYFEEIHIELSERWIIGRMRLLLLEPRTCLSYHRDPEPRLHMAVDTNPGAFLVVDNEQFNIPADGSVWFTDTTTYHSAYNGGEENRVHLVMTCLGKQEELNINTYGDDDWATPD